jgi:PmbA protein
LFRGLIFDDFACITGGADEVEAYCVTDRSVSINTKLEHIEYARESFARGIGIRAIVSGAVGFSSTNREDSIEEASLLAVRSARASQPDPDWSSLPHQGSYPAVHGVFDPKLAGIELSECVELAADLIRGVTSAGAVPTSGGLAVSTGTGYIVNTNGIEHTEEGTSIVASIECIVKDGSGISTAYEFDISRNLDIDTYEIGKRAGELAKQSLHGGKIETSRTAVLFCPLAIADILEYTFIPSLLPKDRHNRRRDPQKPSPRRVHGREGRPCEHRKRNTRRIRHNAVYRCAQSCDWVSAK